MSRRNNRRPPIPMGNVPIIGRKRRRPGTIQVGHAKDGSHIVFMFDEASGIEPVPIPLEAVPGFVTEITSHAMTAAGKRSAERLRPDPTKVNG